VIQQLRKSVVWQGKQDIRVIEHAMPTLQPGELLVKVESCAICGSDLRIFNHGNPRVASGTIVGHEIAGEIVDIGHQSKQFKMGDRIAVGADVPCGDCVHCQNGRGNCCEINYAIGHQFEGGFTEYMRINALTAALGPVQKLQSTTPYDAAALAEPLACCINGYERGLMAPGRSVVIFGAGPIGMMLALLAPVYEASLVVLIDPTENRLNKAAALNLGHVINPRTTDPVAAVMQLTHGLGADMIFTACPAVEAHEQAIQMLAKRGVVNLFGGLPQTAPSLALSSNFIHYREAYITGSHGSTPAQHQQALAWIEQQVINVDALITHHFPLDAIHSAYRTAASGDAIKVMIKPHAYVS
jgi:L-iditol 2-dehydrogenase